MSRRQSITQISGQFAPRTIEMLRSPALQSTSLSARRILDRLEIELADHGGKENGNLPCTYDDFEKFGIHRHQIAAALAELTALGFIVITRHGRAGNAEFRLPTLFRLTYRNTKYAPPTDDWKKIKTINDAEEVVRTARTVWREKGKIQKSSGRKRQGSVAVSDTRDDRIHSTQTATMVKRAITATTFDISGRSVRDQSGRDPPTSSLRQRISPALTPTNECSTLVCLATNAPESAEEIFDIDNAGSNSNTQPARDESITEPQQVSPKNKDIKDQIEAKRLLAAVVEQANQRWLAEHAAHKAKIGANRRRTSNGKFQHDDPSITTIQSAMTRPNARKP